jgi:hypothetical protein
MISVMEKTRGEDLAAERLAMAFDLYDAAESMMRQNLRRRHPEADDDEIEQRLIEWLLTRRGEGDAVGRVVPWSEREPS